ncbi:MAG: hypothetical protein GY719_42705 [bacterium]|nr:hypothetical protein [bacterium]
MFAKSLHHHIEPFRTFACILTGLLLLAAGNAPAEARSLCSASDELALNTTHRSPWGAGASRDCYRLSIPAPGILTLDVSAPSSPEAEPRLDFLGESAPEGQGAGRYRLLEQRPRGVIVEVEAPGTFFLTVASEDPEQPLAGYKLRNAFVGEDIATPAGIVFCDPVLPESPGGEDSFTPRRFDEGTALLTKAVDDDEDDEVWELSLGPDHPALRRLVSCGLGEVDDHGDTALCATLLAVDGSAAGTLGNAVGDDEDFFTFDLDRQRTVEIKVLEAAAGHVSLYNIQGLRLGASSASAPAARLVRTLPPGRYYLRVQSLWGSEEAYVLSLEVLDAA